MKQLLTFSLTLFVFNALLIAVGVATGALLRLVFPSVDRGMSILIGTLATACSLAAIRFIFGVMGSELDRWKEREEDEEDEDEEEEDESDFSAKAKRESIENINSIIGKMSIVPAPDRPATRSRRRR